MFYCKQCSTKWSIYIYYILTINILVYWVYCIVLWHCAHFQSTNDFIIRHSPNFNPLSHILFLISAKCVQYARLAAVTCQECNSCGNKENINQSCNVCRADLTFWQYPSKFFYHHQQGKIFLMKLSDVINNCTLDLS